MEPGPLKEPSLGDGALDDLDETAEARSRPPASEPDPEPKRRRSPFAWLGRLLVSLVAVLLDLVSVALLAASVFVAVTLAELPRTETLRDARLQEPLRVFSADGMLMAEFGVQRRRPVAFHQIPPLVVNAFLATEDSRFFEHEGVDLVGLARAALHYATTGERTQGGSTITMQVARNFFLSREKTFRRKLAELLLSLHIERTLTKEEILELYLNKIFFGHRAYGISAAAALYYDKGLAELTAAEAAMLAGIPKAPSANNPISNPRRALERRDYILGRMHRLGHIDAEEFAAALAEPDRARLHRREVDLEAGYLAEMVRREMVERFGEDAYRGGLHVTTTLDSRLQRSAQRAVRVALLDYDRRHGWRGPEATYRLEDTSGEALDRLLASVRALPELTAGVVTRVDAREAEVYVGAGERALLDLQAVQWARAFIDENRRGRAPRAVSEVLGAGDLVRLRRQDEGSWELSQAPAVAGALAVVSPHDGAVRALVGGYSFSESKFNRAVDAKRQPGSSFKPFVYAAALHEGWTPASLVKDEPISIRLNRREMWEPENFDHKTLGPIRLRVALTQSRNLASIYLLERVGLDDARTFARRFGFELDDLPLGLSMVLGTAELSPLKMAGAYAVFANGGFRVLPHFISRVENGAGELVFEAKPLTACADCWFRYEEAPAQTLALRGAGREAERVLEPRLAFQMTSLLQDVIKHGTGRRALELEREDLAGKTGTTNEVRDSWFCGFQKDLVAVAWMGFDDFAPLGKGETGGRAGLGMWMELMREALEGRPQAVLDVPEGMVQVRIDKKRGTHTSSTGPGSMVEWVREEYELMLLGPEPVRYAGERETGAKAPRVIDELF